MTGGASGIGARSVRLFVEQGARVVIGDMQESLGRALADELRGSVVFQRTEVSQEAEVKALVAAAEKSFGRLDCIFNNAGFGGALGSVIDTPVEEFDVTFAVLVRGVFLGMKHAAPLIARRRQHHQHRQRRGADGRPLAARVRGGEGRVIQLSRSVALELAPQRIRVNCICPGFIATPLALNTVGRPQSSAQLEAAKAGGDNGRSRSSAPASPTTSRRWPCGSRATSRPS